MKNKRFIVFYAVVVLLLLVTTVTYARYIYTDSTSGTIATAQNYYCESEGITSLSECLIRSDSQQDYDSAISTIENRTSYVDYSQVEPTNVYTVTTQTYNYSSTSSNYMARSTHSTYYYVTESEIFGTDGYTASNITFDSSTGYYQMSNTSTGSIDDIVTTADDIAAGNYKYICGNNLTNANITETNCSSLYIVYNYTTTTDTSGTSYYFKSGVKLSYSVGDTSNSNPGLYVTSDEYSYDSDGDDVDDTNLTYYYRGNVKNNWVSYAGYLWRVVRINGNGTIRMIYSGVDDGSTNHSGSNSSITTSKGTKYASFTASSDVTGIPYRSGATYVGYMYNPEMILDTTPKVKLKSEGGSYTLSNFVTYSYIIETTNYYFFSDFDLETNCSVAGDTCTMTCTNFDSSTGTGDNCIYTTWKSLANDSNNYTTSTSYGSTSSYYYYTNDYKYTCWGEATTASSNGTVTVMCSLVSEILGVVKSTATSSGISQSQAKVRFHGLMSESAEAAQTNVEDSNAKYEVDYWYEKNILDTDYEKYLADEIFCGDRSYTSGNGYNYDSFSTTRYGSYYRNNTNNSPSLICSNTNDSYTVTNSNGNMSLKYPIGLITADEVVLAGGETSSFNYKYYLYTGSEYWTMTPYFINNGYGLMANVYHVRPSGQITAYKFIYNSTEVTIRPVINLRADIEYVSGNGTESEPYVIALPS